MVQAAIAERSGFAAKIVIWVAHRLFFLTRGMTMGVRAACFDEAGRVFLVRHTYVPGWYMPGGGLERGETVPGALEKELREEGNLEIIGPPELFHIYFNRTASKRDHVVFFRVNVRQTAIRKPDYEIAESGFFDLDALPHNVTDATVRRLAELTGKTAKADYW